MEADAWSRWRCTTQVPLLPGNGWSDLQRIEDWTKQNEAYSVVHTHLSAAGRLLQIFRGSGTGVLNIHSEMCTHDGDGRSTGYSKASSCHFDKTYRDTLAHNRTERILRHGIATARRLSRHHHLVPPPPLHRPAHESHSVSAGYTAFRSNRFSCEARTHRETTP